MRAPHEHSYRAAAATALVAALCLCLASAAAHAFGVDFKTGDLSAGAVAFEADVMVSATRLERPLTTGLFLAWQSEIYDSSNPSRKAGGHWGLQILPVSWAPGGALLTVNFGWEMDRAVLPVGVRAAIRTASRPSPFVIDNSARMKAEIEHNIAANPKGPNLFLSYVGNQGGVPGTPWAETDYHVVDWQLNRWYRVRLARSPQPLETTAWVLKRGAQGVYGFGGGPERVRAYAWQVTLTPLAQDGPDKFREAGTPMSLAPFYVPEQLNAVRTFNCWGEALGGTPAYPLRWYQARPRHVMADGSVVEMQAATAGFWGYDQPDNDAGPLGDSRRTHAFYIGYAGHADVGGASYPMMSRNMRSGGALWDDAAKDQPAISADAAPIEWNEAALSAYLAHLPGVRYASRRGEWQGRAVVVDRRVSMPAGSGVHFNYAGMFGPGAEGVRFNVSANDDGWLAKDDAGFSVARGAAGGKPFHAEVEAYAPGTSNPAAWIDLWLIPR